ncbi:phosphoglycerol transferase MdoB-like AlkP superfamily enzyme [Priestia megaterium]
MNRIMHFFKDIINIILTTLSVIFLITWFNLYYSNYVADAFMARSIPLSIILSSLILSLVLYNRGK